MEDLERDGYVLSADPKRVDFARVHRWLAEESYWAAGRPYDLVARSIDGSLPYSVFTSTRATPTPAATAASDVVAPSSTTSGAAVTPSAAATEVVAAPGTGTPGSGTTPGTAAELGSGTAPCSGEQVAFARAVTDGATFAWICDVFVADGHRGRGLGQWMIDTILADLSERGIQRFLLATRDAHDVYRRSGFTELVGAHRFMEIDRRPTRNAILGESPTTRP